MRKLFIWCVAASLLTASSAFAKTVRSNAGHESMLSVGISQGTGEYGLPVTPADDYITPASWGEVGLNAEFGYGMAQDYALAVGFDVRTGNTKQEPTRFAAAASPDIKTTSSAWKIRVGGDRTGRIGDRFKWYMGPGVEYGSGKPKFEATTTVDGENTKKLGISGRLGGVMMLSSELGIKGQIGNTFGMASVEDSGGKTSWWYSDFESVWGIQFALGGK